MYILCKRTPLIQSLQGGKIKKMKLVRTDWPYLGLNMSGVDEGEGRRKEVVVRVRRYKYACALNFVNTVPLLSSFSVNVAFLFVRFFVSRFSSI